MVTDSYFDMFSTKGVEYLIVIAFLVVLFPFWRLITTPSKSLRDFSLSQVPFVLNKIISRIPRGFHLDPTHSWAFLESSGLARVGIDDFLLHVTGPSTAKIIHKPGDSVKKGDVMSILEQKGKTLNVYSPISGRIKKRNRKLVINSKKLNDSPYDKGWLYTIEPDNWVRDSKRLILVAKAEEWLKNEFDRLKDFFVFSTRKYSLNPELVVLQEGGEIKDRVLQDLPKDIWQEFQIEFLDANKQD